MALTALALTAGGLGYYFGRSGDSAEGPQQESPDGRKILYWHDPMVPQEHYDNPDSLSSMGMKTVPKYADEGDAAGGPPGVTDQSGGTAESGHPHRHGDIRHALEHAAGDRDDRL